MGLKAVDITPISSTGPTPLIPAGKDLYIKAFSVARTTTAVTLLAVLPADASVVNVDMLGSSNSNAGTTAAVTVTVANNSGTISTGTVNVLTGGATTAPVNMTALPNLEPLPLNGDLRISAQYAETGAASSSGGPWTFVVYYVR